MKKLFVSVFLLAAMTSTACTNLIAGKKATTDGSVLCTYSADDYGMFINLCHYPAGKHKPGTMRPIHDWDSGVYLGQIPEAAETYNVIGNINEYQVTIGETTFGGREELTDTTSIIDYGSLIYIALQRSRTAREAIRVMTSLVEKHGFHSGGESFTICDPDEAWIMEMVGKGTGGKGAVWVAVRIPDNAICAHANQARIRKFDRKDKQNVMYSKDVIRFAREKGWFNGKDDDFDFAAAYCPADFGGRRFCDARVYSFFRKFDKGMDKYLPWVLGKEENAEPMPLWIVPDRKVSLEDMRECMRDHYEGTPLSLDQDMGGGIWEMPYRPTPLSYEVDGRKYFNERPISTQQSAFSYVSQMRSWLPRQVGGILWFANDDGNMTPYIPIYCGNTVQPECFNTEGADAVTFSDKNAYWVCNWVSNMVYPRYAQMFPSLKAVRDSIDHALVANQKAVEEKAAALCAQSPESAVEYLNGYSNAKAQEMLARWKRLATYLIVKYNDMTVKPEKDGRFARTKTGIGARVQRPGYPAGYAKGMSRQVGERMMQP